MKNDKTNLIIWATVALVIGIVVGAFLIGPMTTTGNAKAALRNSSELQSSLNEGYAGILVSEAGCLATGGTANGFPCCRYCRYTGESGKVIDVSIYTANPTLITSEKEMMTGGTHILSITAADCIDIGGYVSGRDCLKYVEGKKFPFFIDSIR